MPDNDRLQAVPSIDYLLRLDAAAPLLARYGRALVTAAFRQIVDLARDALVLGGEDAAVQASDSAIVAAVERHLDDVTTPSLTPVFNLTGTVLHTNLGRAPLPREAIEAMSAVAAGASNLEYDLVRGRRGDRDTHLEGLLCRLTGAEAVTVVNNNAAAVLLVLNALALRKEVLVSRGELIEIGGAFRIPDVMKRAGAKLVEVGTTNRTHGRDFADAIGPRTAMVMRIHTSNYVVEGFTATVPEKELAGIARQAGIPFVVDLGSGTLIDLSRFGLPHEPTVGETLEDGADLVTFSGDKLLGGPQAGIIAGRADLVARIKRNPMKRALRIDKLTIAALDAVCRLYEDPDRLAERLPAIRILARSSDEIRQLAQRLLAPLATCVADYGSVEVTECRSQIGSGALPVDLLPSFALSVAPAGGKRSGKAVVRIARAFRELPVPVIGRIEDGRFRMDLRCLDDEAGFIAQLAELRIGAS